MHTNTAQVRYTPSSLSQKAAAAVTLAGAHTQTTKREPHRYRAHPDYLQYYYKNRNANPRLPPPIITSSSRPADGPRSGAAAGSWGPDGARGDGAEVRHAGGAVPGLHVVGRREGSAVVAAFCAAVHAEGQMLAQCFVSRHRHGSPSPPPRTCNGPTLQLKADGHTGFNLLLGNPQVRGWVGWHSARTLR